MAKGGLRTLAVGGGAVVVVVALLSVALAGPRKIKMEWVGDAECVKLDPADPRMWQDRFVNTIKFKPKRVKWVVKKEQRNKYYWEFSYDSTSTDANKNKPGRGDFLSDVDPIKCKNPQHTTSKKVKDQKKDVNWPYAITVWECKDGIKDPDKDPCTKDPVIWIRR